MMKEKKNFFSGFTSSYSLYDFKKNESFISNGPENVAIKNIFCDTKSIHPVDNKEKLCTFQ